MVPPSDGSPLPPPPSDGPSAAPPTAGSSRPRGGSPRSGAGLAALAGADLRGLDIYLLDQCLRGRIAPGARVLDAGCGGGRNLRPFLAAGHECWAVDRSEALLAGVRALFAELAPDAPGDRVRCEALDALSVPEQSFELVIANAVLHFARDEEHFDAMLDACWRRVCPGGLLFARLASTIGLEGRFTPVQGRRQRQPDGDERFLVDQPFLLERVARLGAVLLDPLKTTVVQDARCMTTWVLGRPPAS